MQDLATEDLGSATSHSIHIEAEKLGHVLFTTMSALQALQPGVESPLLFIQQTIKQRLGRFQVIAWRLLSLPCGPLLLPSRSVHRAIQITAFPLSAM